MKTLLKLFFIILFFGAIIISTTLIMFDHAEDKGYVTLVNTNDLKFWKKPCDEPLRYSLGTVDPSFKISESEFLYMIKQAEALWEKDAQLDLFEYDPTAQFKINLVYDQRQEDTIRSQMIKEDIDERSESYDSLTNSLTSLEDTHEVKLAKYNKKVSEYQEELEEYEDDVKKWNKKGGAPQDVFDDLKDKKEDLDEMYDKLEELREDLNTVITRSQDLVSEINATAQEINNQVETYNQRYGGHREFDQGVYYGTHINIYQYQEMSDLKLVLAHELGHAIGIKEHVQDPLSIMYYLMGEQDLNEPSLSSQDISMLRVACELE